MLKIKTEPKTLKINLSQKEQDCPVANTWSKKTRSQKFKFKKNLLPIKDIKVKIKIK